MTYQLSVCLHKFMPTLAIALAPVTIWVCPELQGVACGKECLAPLKLTTRQKTTFLGFLATSLVLLQWPGFSGLAWPGFGRQYSTCSFPPSSFFPPSLSFPASRQFRAKLHLPPPLLSSSVMTFSLCIYCSGLSRVELLSLCNHG
jgi:hypothetical protein